MQNRRFRLDELEIRVREESLSKLHWAAVCGPALLGTAPLPLDMLATARVAELRAAPARPLLAPLLFESLILRLTP